MRPSSPSIFAVSLASLLLVPSSALAQEAPPPSEAAPAEAAPSAELPPPMPPPPTPAGCQVTARLDVEGRHYVACAAGAVHVYEGATPVGQHPTGGEPVALFERGGRVWVERVERTAVALSSGAGTLGAPSAASPATTAPGAESGSELAPALAPPPPLAALPPLEAQGPTFEGPADLDPDGSYRDRVAPERVSGFELALDARPFLGSGAAGFLATGHIAYRAERPFFARLNLEPFGYSGSGRAQFGQFHGLLSLGYDHDWFEMSLGVGVMRARLDDWDRRFDGVGVTLSNTVRLGARDGLHLSVTNSFVVVGGSPEWASVSSSMQIPLRPGKWLVFRGGGGGAAGFAYGDVGLRILTRGDRGPGSLFITPAVGGVGVFDDIRFERAGGFTMTVGLEYRP